MQEIETVAGGNAIAAAATIALGVTTLVVLSAIYSGPNCSWEIIEVPGSTFVPNPRYENGRYIEGDLVEYTVPEKRWVCR